MSNPNPWREAFVMWREAAPYIVVSALFCMTPVGLAGLVVWALT